MGKCLLPLLLSRSPKRAAICPIATNARNIPSPKGLLFGQSPPLRKGDVGDCFSRRVNLLGGPVKAPPRLRNLSGRGAGGDAILLTWLFLFTFAFARRIGCRGPSRRRLVLAGYLLYTLAGNPGTAQVLEQGSLSRKDNSILLTEEFLVGFQAAPESKEVRVLVQGFRQYPDSLSLAFTTDAGGIPVGLGQNNFPFAVGDGPDPQVLLFTLGPETGGDAVAFGPHSSENAGGHRFGEVGALKADVNHLDAEFLLLYPALDGSQHLVKHGRPGLLGLDERQAFLVHYNCAGFVQYWLGPDELKAVSQGHLVSQGGDNDIPQAAAGVKFTLQRSAELDRVGNAVTGVEVDSQVLLVTVG